jgi:hypothetical protein
LPWFIACAATAQGGQIVLPVFVRADRLQAGLVKLGLEKSAEGGLSHAGQRFHSAPFPLTTRSDHWQGRGRKLFDNQ